MLAKRRNDVSLGILCGSCFFGVSEQSFDEQNESVSTETAQETGISVASKCPLVDSDEIGGGVIPPIREALEEESGEIHVLSRPV